MIEVSDLGYAYPGGREVLQGVTFGIAEGARLGLLGDNGSGKTTLARLLCGLIAPTAGSVMVDGLATTAPENIYEVRRRVGLVFQDPEQQMVETTVEREIGFGPRNLGLEPSEVSGRVDDAVRLFGLDCLRKRPCHLLSAGEKQLVAVASVFTMKPAYVVLDEPTALLDPNSRRMLIEAFEALVGETGAGSLFISMRIEDAWLCDEVMFLVDGKILFRGGADGLVDFMRDSGMPLSGLGMLAAQARNRPGGRALIPGRLTELGPESLAAWLGGAAGTDKKRGG
jgi:energy-coupling factor transport system ATP-binding protein